MEILVLALVAFLILGEVKGEDAGKDEQLVSPEPISTAEVSRMLSQRFETVATVWFPRQRNALGASRPRTMNPMTRLRGVFPRSNSSADHTISAPLATQRSFSRWLSAGLASRTPCVIAHTVIAGLGHCQRLRSPVFRSRTKNSATRRTGSRRSCWVAGALIGQGYIAVGRVISNQLPVAYAPPARHHLPYALV
jgi:hypothetical protein